MDYQFIRNDENQVQAFFSDDYIILSYFLSDELGDDLTKIDFLIRGLELSEQKPNQVVEWSGKSVQLIAQEGGVSISSHALTEDYLEELPESTELSDMDQSCESGLLDFYEMLKAWRLFCAE